MAEPGEIQPDGGIVVPATSKSSFFTRTTAAGAAIGNLVPVFWPLGIPIGAVIGAVKGKLRMDREEKEGKVVEPPTAWNKDTVIGASLGATVGVVLGIVVAVLAGGTALASAVEAANGAKGAALSILMNSFVGAAAAGIGTFLASVVGGAWLGGKHGKARMTQEYEAAKEYVFSHHQSRALGRSQSQDRAPVISQEETRLLEARMRKGGDLDFATSVSVSQGIGVAK